MRKALGILCMLLGMALVLGALSLFLNNQQEDRQAREHTQQVLPVLQQEIQQIREETLVETSPAPADYTPAEYLSPEDLLMTEKVISGYAYIGYLFIPDLELELPVMSGWDSRRLQISPCRYTGTLRGEDLVIMAHNYASHFGRLNQLTEGASVRFVDMDGRTWDYEVAAKDILAAESVEEMTAGEYDLTLFTCDTNRTHRVTIRCSQKEA